MPSVRRLSAVLALVASPALLAACRSAPTSRAPAAAPRSIGTALRDVRLEGSGWGDYWTIEIVIGTAGAYGRLVVRADPSTVDTLAADYRCRMRRVASTTGQPWACAVPFPDGTPDWDRLAARLEQAGAAEPPPLPSRAVQPTPPGTIVVEVCTHEAPWVLTWTDRRTGRTVRTQEPCGTTTAAWAQYVATVAAVRDTIHAAAMGPSRWRELHP